MENENVEVKNPQVDSKSKQASKPIGNFSLFKILR